MTGTYHKYNIAGKLRTVVLGSFFGPEYFEFIIEDIIRKPLQRAAHEINQDLDHFQRLLESHGVRVLRPELVSVKQFKEFFDLNQYFLTPPLQPRNNHAVLGDRCYRFTKDHSSIVQCLELYNSSISDLSESNKKFFADSLAKNISNYDPVTDTWYRKQKYQELAGPDWPKFDDYMTGDRSSVVAIQKEMLIFDSEFRYESKEVNPAEGPNFMVLGNRLVIDCNEYCDYVSWSKQHIPGFEVYDTINTTAGHTDGCFVIVGKNTIVGIDPLIDYHKHFPGYTVVKIPPKNYQDVIHKYYHSHFHKMKAWFIDGESRNYLLQEYIDKYFEKYTGFSPETVFDVNVLALDEHNVFVTSEISEVIDPLAQKQINCIHVPWRHRWFVDCGLHCLTLDLHRDD